MAKISHSNAALDDCLGHSTQCETERAMKQAAKLMAGFKSAVTEEEQQERADQFKRENHHEREKTDREEHGFYY